MPKPSLSKQRALTQERLKELFHYDRLTGVFTRKVAMGRHGRYPVGSVAGYIGDRGYVSVVIGRYTYSLHRLAWLYETGEWPADGVDHKDGVHHHNWIDNLRPASQWQNAQNARMPRTNTSGYLGVTWHKSKKKWCAAIAAKHVRRYLGAFDSPEAAHAAYLAAKAEMHEFQPTVRAE